ncbi:MAG: glycosyl hydrolase, partial [Saprospiraceae bacterium]|nr:glycosyl hydrolase [Saprospiraceae bacterium]
SDFAMDPKNPKTYYVATSAGGVWKTENAGTTYKPIFDSQGSFSIGCVTLDPGNPNVVWVGTGENNNQRSVNYGDGVYKSEDGGASWTNMGLKNSEHIGSIIVHPENSNIIFVAAIGPLWSDGGERGVYKSIDGGKTWTAVLTIDEHTGVNEVVMDPRNPDILYASALQRRRHVFTYIGGGPGSGLYKSTDGGETWAKANKGLPSVDLGRIGLSISPADPEIIYAIVEAADDKGGFYRSTNRGASWEKRGGYSSSGNYYQEIVADPNDPDKIFAMDTWLQYSVDGGKTFKNVGEDTKHVDNHCIWIDSHDTDHFLVGCDGGIYETWDHAQSWNFKANLPVTQFYKVAVDNSEPFYYVYGGTQDNFSLGGPSRTLSSNGISNDEWFITHGGDGFESQIDPFNPNIVYAQSQYGNLARYDRLSGEEVGIQPKPREGEDDYIWNWDAPLEVSSHQEGRLYFAANKVFRSDDRGNSWQVISEDLSRQINRNELKVMGRVWSIDAVAKNGSTSQYGAVVAFSESPVNENVLIAGTDDGLIQITTDGGQNWKKIEVPGVPERTYVNEVLASHHSENVFYVAFNNHKNGDFKPYVFKTTDGGNSWINLNANLPERGSVYAIEEDHIDADLLFIGTEFGLFFSNDGGQEWKQLKAGLPTTMIRDIAIQERENDLVLASFGRGFYVLDDYSVLRSLKNADLDQDTKLLAVRDAKTWEWSTPYGLPGKAFQGDDFYQGDNMGPEALITFYVKDKIETLEDKRKEEQKKLEKDGKDVKYPSYDELTAEIKEEKPMLFFVITDVDGNIVRKLDTAPKTGVNRITWDLRYASKDPINLSRSSFYNPFAGSDQGYSVPPGEYMVTMYLWKDGEMKKLDESKTFKVESLNIYSLPVKNYPEMESFKKDVAKLQGALGGTRRIISDINNELRHVRQAIMQTEIQEQPFLSQVVEIENALRDIQKNLYGDRVASQLDLPAAPSVAGMIGSINYEGKYATAQPTQTHLDLYQRAKKQFGEIIGNLNNVIKEKLEPLRTELQKAGAPYTPNTLPDMIKF